MNWIASLPMYNVTPALASHWRALLFDTLRVAAPGARIEERGDDLYALWRDRPDEVARRVRSFTPQAGPGAFWMRRRPEAGTRH